MRWIEVGSGGAGIEKQDLKKDCRHYGYFEDARFEFD